MSCLYHSVARSIVQTAHPVERKSDDISDDSESDSDDDEESDDVDVYDKIYECQWRLRIGSFCY